MTARTLTLVPTEMSLALKLALSPLLVAQALRTRARVPRLPEAAGAREGVHGRGATRLRLLIAGDSSAAGVGVTTQERCPVRPVAALDRASAATCRSTGRCGPARA